MGHGWRRLVSHLAVMLIARPLDVLATGETTAQSLGLDLARWRVVIVVLAGLLTAGAVIQGGTIGFIGMVIPHLVRLALRDGRASRGGSGRGARRRHLVSRGRPRRAHRGGAAPAAGRRNHGVVRRAGVPGAAATTRRAARASAAGVSR